MNDEISDGIGVSLIRVITAAVDTIFEVHACSLLDDVGRFVRGCMQIGAVGKPNAIPGRIRGGAELTRRFGGRSADLRANVRHIVLAEALLNSVEMRQRCARR